VEQEIQRLHARQAFELAIQERTAREEGGVGVAPIATLIDQTI